jgi:nitrite reductase/ring-hydroxylating ferredoxin subunit
VTTAETTPRPGLFDISGPGYHQCWYPVALSTDLAAGQVLGVDLADGRVAVYRTESGDVHAMVPYCKHMGSDLSVGAVVGDQLRCAFHHWHYGTDGRCSKIPSGDRIPAAARLATFPVEDRWGVIWVFWGPTPLYQVPSFQAWDDKTMVYRAFEVPLSEPLQVDPWVFTSNIFDIVHNRVVHGLQIADPTVEVVDDYIRKMRWDATYMERESGSLRSDILVYGTNAISTSGEHDGRATWHIAGLGPHGRQGTRVFIMAATTKGPGAEEHLDREQALHSRFVNEDLPILNTIRLGEDHLVANDRAMVRYLRYAREYPRATMAELETVDRAGC